MTYQAITVDPEQKQKIGDMQTILTPEDAFILNDSKELGISIQEGGFNSKLNRSLVFIFSDDSIRVIQANVSIIGGYALNEFDDILSIAEHKVDLNEDDYHSKVLNKMFERYLQLSNNRRCNRNKSITTNILLKTILTYLNKAIGSYYGLDSINLKDSHYHDFYNQVTMKEGIILK
jgi:hypothetical protein